MFLAMSTKVEKWIWPVASMLLVQVLGTGLQLLSRVILSQGTFIFALMTYRHLIGALCVAPFSFFFERGNNNNEVKLSWSVWFWLFLNALTGITMGMGLYYYGLKDTTATYAANFLNLIPILTFLFSIIARMEKLGGKMKTVGAILCVGGALTTGLYKGQGFHIGNHHPHFQATINNTSNTHWARGTAFLLASCFSYATWFLVQVKLLQKYPLKYRVTMFTCIIASLQSAAVGMCLNRDVAAWRLGWNLQLLTIVYSGSLATAASFSLISWAVANEGPTYPSMFNPLSLIFVALLEALILGELIRIGTILGMVLIITGLYSFLWGRGRETKMLPQQDVKAAPKSAGTVVPRDSRSPLPARERTHSDLEQNG